MHLELRAEANFFGSYRFKYIYLYGIKQDMKKVFFRHNCLLKKYIEPIKSVETFSLYHKKIALRIEVRGKFFLEL